MCPSQQGQDSSLEQAGLQIWYVAVLAQMPPKLVLDHDLYLLMTEEVVLVMGKWFA